MSVLGDVLGSTVGKLGEWTGLKETDDERAAREDLERKRQLLNPDWSEYEKAKTLAQGRIGEIDTAAAKLAGVPETAPFATEYALRSTWSGGAADSPLAAARQQAAALRGGVDTAAKGAEALSAERLGREQALLQARQSQEKLAQSLALIEAGRDAALRRHAVAEAERAYSEELAKRQHKQQIVGGILGGAGAAASVYSAKQNKGQ